MLAPAYSCGISVPEGVWEAHSQEPSFEHYRSRTIRLLEENLTPITPSDVTEPGGVAPQAPEMPPPHIPVSGDAPSHSWSASASSNAGDTWLGTEGSLGPYRQEAKDPKSPFSEEVSKALTSSLRHSNGPKIEITPSGYADLSHILALPRLKKLRTTAADVLEIVRHSPKERFQLKKEGHKILLRAVQGHSRQDLGDKEAYDALEPHAVPTLLAHGSFWRHYDSIFKHGLQPGGRSSQRCHTHLIDADIPATEIKSGFRDNVEMIFFVAGREAAEAGLQFFRSTNFVYLTAQVISPIYFRGTRDSAAGTEYDNKCRVCA